jgi:hypothetical protein
MVLMVLGDPQPEEEESEGKAEAEANANAEFNGATNNFVALVSLAFSGITFALMN